MADVVKELVSKWNLDVSSWSTSVKQAQKTIKDASATDSQRTAASLKATQQSIDLLKQEITMAQKLITIKVQNVEIEQALTSTKAKQQQLSSAASKQELDAISLQIAAEKLKEAAAKSALAEQRRSAQEAIQIAKNAMKQQQQAAADAAAAAKAAISNAQKSATAKSGQDFTKIPIVSGVTTPTPLPERDAEAANKRVQSSSVLTAQATAAQQAAISDVSTAAAASSDAVVTANERVKTSVDAVTLSYQALAKAQIDLALADANVRETKSAIVAGTLNAPDNGAARLATDMQAQAEAQARVQTQILALKEAQNNTEGSLLSKQRQELEVEVAQARQQELAALRADIQQRAQAEAAMENRSLFRKMFNMPPAGSGGGSGNGSVGASAGSDDEGAGHMHIGNMVATRAVAGAAAGRGGYRAMEYLIAGNPVLSGMAQMAFPLVGLSMFVDMAFRGVEAFKQMKQEVVDLPIQVANAYTAETVSMQKGNDQLDLADDNIKNVIAKLEHKPVNNIAIAFDEARIKADELYSTTSSLEDKLTELMQKADPSIWTKAFAAIKGFFQGQSDSFASDDDVLKFKPANQATTDATAAYQAAQHNDALNINPATERDSAKLAAYNKAKTNLDAAREKVSSSIDAQIKAYQDELTKVRAPKHEKVLRTDEFGRDLSYTVDSTPNQNTTYTKSLQGSIAILQAQKDSLSKETRNLNDQNTQKDLEERKRLGQLAIADSRARLEAQKAMDQEAYESSKSSIDKLADANTELYKNGLEAARAYYGERKALAISSYGIELNKIKEDAEAERAQLALERRDNPEMTKTQYESKRTVIDSGEKTKIAAAADRRDKELANIDQLQTAAGLEANKQKWQAEFDARMKSLQSQTDAVKDSFDQQSMSADAYVARMTDIYNQQLAAHQQFLDRQLSQLGQFDERRTSLERQRSDVGLDTSRQIYQLNAGAPAMRLQHSQTGYENQMGLLNAQQSLLNAPNNSSNSLNAQLGVNAGQRLATSQQISELLSQQDRLDASSENYVATWSKIQTAIVNARTELLKLSEDHDRLVDNTAKLGGTLATGVTDIGQAFGSNYARHFEQAVSSAGTYATHTRGYVNDFTSAGSVFGGEGLFGGKDSSSSQPTPFGTRLNTSVENFSKKMTSAAEAVGGFIGSIANAQSASAGGVAGGVAGASLGTSAGSAMSSMGGMMGALGPYAGLIGGAAGSALGAVFGQKQEEVTDDVNLLNASFKKTMDSFQSNNTGLQQTIENLQSLIAQANADMAATKKGGSQFKDLIQQYNQQIVQLEQQQQQELLKLANSLTILGQASPYQDMLSNIQDILTQYSQFAGAAQSANDLANANQFLVSSLQQLGQSYTQQLIQNETTAVQDALQLNELYTQRNSLQLQFLQSTEQIMGQGTLTRGITASQSKFSKLYSLDVNYQNQMQQMNAQIDTEQYKVQAEQQIFNLTQTRQGLEQQLVTLQMQGINLDMGRIAAMQNLLAVLSKTGYSITNLGGINAGSDPNQTVTTLLGILTSLLGNGSTSSSIAGSNGNSLLSSILGSSLMNQSGLGYSIPRV